MAVLRLGIAGFGNEGQAIAKQAKEAGDYVELVAAADLRSEARASFEAACPGARAFDSVEAMCDSNVVDAIWVATPNPLHADHTVAAAERGKHVILEKPMAVTMDEADRMVAAVERNQVHLLMHSHASDYPVVEMRKVITSGRIGELIGIHSWSYKGWLRSPRLPFEVDTTKGGGVVYRQGPHQMEIVRRIGGGLVHSVRATPAATCPSSRPRGTTSLSSNSKTALPPPSSSMVTVTSTSPT